MKSLEEKPFGPPTVSKKPEPYFPSITVDGSDFPDLAKKRVGSSFPVLVDVKKTRHEEVQRTGQKGKRVEIGLQLRGLETDVEMDHDVLEDLGYKVKG